MAFGFGLCRFGFSCSFGFASVAAPTCLRRCSRSNSRGAGYDPRRRRGGPSRMGLRRVPERIGTHPSALGRTRPGTGCRTVPPPSDNTVEGRRSTPRSAERERIEWLPIIAGCGWMMLRLVRRFCHSRRRGTIRRGAGTKGSGPATACRSGSPGIAPRGGGVHTGEPGVVAASRRLRIRFVDPKRVYSEPSRPRREIYALYCMDCILPPPRGAPNSREVGGRMASGYVFSSKGIVPKARREASRPASSARCWPIAKMT